MDIIGAVMGRYHKMFSFGLAKRIALYERLADFLDNRFPVEDALEVIALRYKNNKDYRAVVISEWRRKMAAGQKFSDAIKSQVPADERVLIAAGENSGGGLPQGLREAIRLSQAIAKIKGTIIAGSIYPAILFTLILGALAGFSVKISPVFQTILPLEYWPDSGKTLNSISEFIVSQWWFILAIVVGLGYIITISLPRWTGSIREVADKFPPYSIYKEYNAASFLIALSSMMMAGVSLNEAMQKIQEKAAPWMRHHVSKMLKKLRVAGSDYGKALDTGLLDKEVAGDLQDYAKLSSFEKAVYGIGQKTLETTVKSIDGKMSALRYLMMVGAAGMILWIFGTSYLLQQEVADKAGQIQNKK